jgi:Rps23 Pro-64 3,4-dihydroxylase Tpa1-like proline 4-hydroxylase
MCQKIGGLILHPFSLHDRDMIDCARIGEQMAGKKDVVPFDHWVIRDFFPRDLAETLESEFPDYDDSRWFSYDNAIERKKALNQWSFFPSFTYRVLQELSSTGFVEMLSKQVGVRLFPDAGLHGGGWHIHGPGGNLNPHLDYSIHPKLKLQRKLNLIIYLSSSLKPEHGGHLGLWAPDNERQGPGELVREVAPEFNTAVIFDTTQDSWHGLSQPLTQPAGVYRKSLAVYYLCEPSSDVPLREKALFAPRDFQKGDPSVAELIRRRADSVEFASVYRVKIK